MLRCAPNIATFAFFVIGFVSANFVDAGVVISNNYVRGRVADSAGGNDVSDQYSGTVIPASQLVDASSSSFYARDQLSYSQSGSGAYFSNVISMQRGGFAQDLNHVSSQMQFSVDANISYEATGHLLMTDVSTAGHVVLQSTLLDVTANNWVFYSRQDSYTTVDESFVLGGSGGDSVNTFSGSLTGTLIAGHNYEWFYQHYSASSPGGDGGAAAIGSINLKFGDGGTGFHGVPEPTSCSIWGLGLIALVIRRRCQRVSS